MPLTNHHPHHPTPSQLEVERIKFHKTWLNLEFSKKNEIEYFCNIFLQIILIDLYESTKKNAFGTPLITAIYWETSVARRGGGAHFEPLQMVF